MRNRPVMAVLAAASPLLIAIWTVPWFVTQDGPAHAYTASLLALLIGGESWLDQSLVVQPKPLPNLVSPALMAAVSMVMPGRTADRLLMSLAFVLPALTAMQLRRAVRGADGLLLLVPFVVLISISRLWLLGFYSFLVGVALFNVTLLWWWRVRDRLSIGNATILSVLLLAGWFAHLVSFAITVFALLFLAVSTRRRTLLLTAASVLPTVPLAVWYAGVMTGHAGVSASYVRLRGTSVIDLLQYARSIKFLSIAKQTDLPFVDRSSPAVVLLAPAVLASLAFLIWSIWSFRSRRGGGGSWGLLAAILLAVAVVAPDGLGLQHGGFLRERLFLLGLFAAIPTWHLEPNRATRTAAALALLGVVVQSAFAWEYALRSHRAVAPLARASAAIPDRSRVLVIRPKPRDEFRASPRHHAANLLGLDREVVVWNNYQANLYFFPVNFRRPFLPCSEDGACEVRQNRHRIDIVVVWNTDRKNDEVVVPFFPRLLTDSDELRVYGR